MPLADRKLRDRAGDWLRRYLPAELACTPAALACGLLAHAVTGRVEAAALAATWGEVIAFHALMVTREVRRRGGSRSLSRVLRDLSLELGLAEALDSLLLRPGLLYLGVAFAPDPALGVLAGKLAADLAFYAVAITGFEMLRARSPGA